MRKKGFTPIIILLTIVTLGVLGYFAYTKGYLDSLIPRPKLTVNPEPISTPSPTLQPTSKPTTQKPIPTSKPKTTPTNTPSPTKQPYTGVCQVNTLAGSNPNEVVLTYGLTSSGGRYMKEARWDLNNDGEWDHEFSSSNARVTTNLTSGGSKTVRLQLKLSDGTLTDVCTKNITTPSGTWISIWGYVFSDNNCSGFMDSSESGIANVPVRITKTSDYSTYGTANTDGSGKFSYTTLLNDLLEMTVTMTSPSGYKSHPNHVIGNSLMGYGKNTNVQMNIPQVPNESVGQCSF